MASVESNQTGIHAFNAVMEATIFAVASPGNHTMAGGGSTIDSPSHTYNGTLFQVDDEMRHPSSNATTNSVNGSGVFPEPAPDLSYVYISVTVFYAGVFLFGVLGNVLVIFVICRNKDMSTATNLFLANLSVADILVLLICMPSAMTELHAREKWLFGNAMCKLIVCLENMVAHGSILTMLVISFERYYAICCPLKVLYTCTKRRAAKIITGVWLCSFVTVLPFLSISFAESVRHTDGSDVEVCSTPINTRWRECYVIAKFMLLFLVPCVMLVSLYTLICRQMLKDDTIFDSRSVGGASVSRKLACCCSSRSRKTVVPPSHGPASSSGVRRRGGTPGQRKQVIYMLIVIIAFSFVCLLPFQIVTLWLIYSSNEQKHALGIEGYLNLISFSRVMFYLNSAGNPILYNLVSTKFRSACRRSLGSLCGRRAPYQASRPSMLTYSTDSRRSIYSRTTTCDFDSVGTSQNSTGMRSTVLDNTVRSSKSSTRSEGRVVVNDEASSAPTRIKSSETCL